MRSPALYWSVSTCMAFHDDSEMADLARLSRTDRNGAFMTKRIADIFAEYSHYHNHPMNQVFHYIGIPMIVVSILGLLSLITFGSAEFSANVIRPDMGMALMLFGLGFYFFMD
ncbi:MAG: DUF962 domain-containing protein, partial [Proteobacteria bacterium]